MRRCWQCRMVAAAPCGPLAQVPCRAPGEKYFSNLPSSPLNSSASSGGGRLRVMLGQALRVVAVELQPLLGLGLGVGQDRLDRAFRLAHAAVDALVGVDDQHVLALVEAVHGADLDAVHVLAPDAGFGDHVGHRSLRLKARFRGRTTAPGRRRRTISAASRPCQRFSAPPAEQPLDVLAPELDIGRPAVIALAGERASPPSAAGARSSPRARSRRPARTLPWQATPASDRLQRLRQAERRSGASARSAARSRTSSPADAWPSRAGSSRTSTAPAPNGSTTRPSSASSAARASSRARSAALQLDHLGQQQRLPAHAAVAQLGLQPLVDDPLVRRVLVDQDQAGRGLGQDLAAVQLGPRRTQRVGGRGRGLGQRRGRQGAPTASAASWRAGRAPRPGRHRPAGRPAGRRPARKAPRAAVPAAALRWPCSASARFRAPTTRPRTSAGSRKRTSALAGWTLTSTSSGGSSRNRAATGWRSWNSRSL